MKLGLIGAALAAATLAQAGVGDYLGAEPRQLGRRLNLSEDTIDVADTDTVAHHHLEGRSAASEAKAKAHAAAVAAAKAKAKASSKARASSSKAAAAAAKSKASASSKSKSLASRSSSLAAQSRSLASLSKSLAIKASSAASKASSIASRSASASSAAAASSASAASAAASLSSLQAQAASASASLSSLAAANSAAAASIASAQASLSSAASAFSASVDGATASAGSQASSIASARSSLSTDGASLTSAAASVSSASIAVASSASVVSAQSASLDAASSSLYASASSEAASFGSISSALSSQSAALAGASSSFVNVVASISAIASQQSVASTALAASAANIASQTSSLAAAATASGLATACLLPTYLANGNCFSQCPAAYPVTFSRDGTYGLCCTKGSKECINASPTGATVCADNLLHTVLDQHAQSGTCSTTCCTVEDGVAYQFKQLGGVYDECVVAQDCVNGVATADPNSGLCCDDDVATCADSTPTGALSCTAGHFFTPNSDAPNSTGTCASSCASNTFYSAGAGANTCLAKCPVPTGFFAKSSGNYCCADANAATCSSASVATACVAGFALTPAGKCVASDACPNGAADSKGVCCPDGALSCSSATVATACGLDHSLSTPAQTYLNSDGTCVPRSGCANGASVLGATKGGICCADSGSLTCSSAAPGASLTCDASSHFFLSPSSAAASTGTCVKYCAGSNLDPTTSTCVNQCASGSAFTDSATGQQTCCAVGQGSCDGSGKALTCSKAAGYFLQPGGKACSTTCPGDSVKAASGGLCCAQGTSDCSAVAKTGAAITCTSAYSLLASTCVASCPTGTVASTNSKGTNVCDCVVKNAAQCGPDGSATQCAASFFLFTPADGSAPSCPQICPAGAVADAASGTCLKCPSGSVPNAAATMCVAQSSTGVASRNANGVVTACSSGYSLRTFTGGIASCSSSCYSSTVGSFVGYSDSVGGCSYYCAFQAPSKNYAYALQASNNGFAGGCYCLGQAQTSATTYGTQVVPSACGTDVGVQGSSYKLYYLS